MRVQEYIKNVTTLKLDTNKCVGCGVCTHVCPHRVFKVKNKKAVILDKDLCMECGACAKNCPVEAINVRPGVGCAYGIILGRLRGTGPTCGCDDDAESSNKSSCG